MSTSDGTRPIGASRPGPQPFDAFGSLDDLDARGRRVFLRVDPFLLESLDDPAPASPPPADGAAPAAQAASAGPDGPAGGPEPDAPAASDAAGAARAEAPPAPRSTLEQLIQLEARVVLATHFTPEDRRATGLDGVEGLASRLSERLGLEVLMPDECVGDAALRVIHDLRQGQLCVLPDLLSVRGQPEQRNDEAFARALSSSLEAYVFDAFSVSHLEYASTVKLPRLLPRRTLGQACRRELSALSGLFALNRGSVGLALGGRTFSEKIDTLSEWLSRVDRACIGGSVALTLLAAAGRAPAEASPEPERLAQARSLLARARDLGVALTLPTDFRVQLEGDRGTLVKRAADLHGKLRIIDIGPESTALFGEVLGKAKHLLWWGPLGDTRHPEGSFASRQMAELCARPDVMSVVLGGDTRRFVRREGAAVTSGIDLVSTGSAAARALLAGRRLPGVEAVRARR